LWVNLIPTPRSVPAEQEYTSFVLAPGADITRHRKKDCFLEIYSEGRYFTVTGNVLDGVKNIETRTAELPINFFCVHGNHKRRPETLGHKETTRHGGTVYGKPEFPSILFAKNGEISAFGGKKCIAIGGAYGVDKPVCLAEGWGWWSDEQPSQEIRERVEVRLNMEGWCVNIVLSHTVPLKYEMYEKFIDVVDQAGVDKTTEQWLDTIGDRLDYKRWYCGHYHTDKVIDKIQFLYNDFIEGN
jgi:3-oxoacid CoA-transferase subunit A